LENEADDFFESAFSMIYNKLTSDEKSEFNEELSGENMTYKELTPKNRFFGLLRFIEVKYMMMTKWIEGISNSLAFMGDSYDGEDHLIDIVFVDAEQNEVSFRELERQGHKFRELVDNHKLLLKQLKLVRDYENYLRSSGFTSEEEYER
jgi:hypothetical protein